MVLISGVQYCQLDSESKKIEKTRFHPVASLYTLPDLACYLFFLQQIDKIADSCE